MQIETIQQENMIIILTLECHCKFSWGWGAARLTGSCLTHFQAMFEPVLIIYTISGLVRVRTMLRLDAVYHIMLYRTVT